MTKKNGKSGISLNGPGLGASEDAGPRSLEANTSVHTQNSPSCVPTFGGSSRGSLNSVRGLMESQTFRVMCAFGTLVERRFFFGRGEG